ncbi:MAG: hypothetical protein H6811_09470 [Phycisphaeraceae bacterium]|nr:hypothetical protein [Phycisphaeraceae bacterium]
MDHPARDVGTAEHVSDQSGRLTREQMVDRIMHINRGASPGFLGSFSDGDLELYLQRLSSMNEPRGRRAVWVRRGDSPAISSRRRRE